MLVFPWDCIITTGLTTASLVHQHLTCTGLTPASLVHQHLTCNPSAWPNCDFTLQSLANPSQAALRSQCPHMVHCSCYNAELLLVPISVRGTGWACISEDPVRPHTSLPGSQCWSTNWMPPSMEGGGEGFDGWDINCDRHAWCSGPLGPGIRSLKKADECSAPESKLLLSAQKQALKGGGTHNNLHKIGTQCAQGTSDTGNQSSVWVPTRTWTRTLH